MQHTQIMKEIAGETGKVLGGGHDGMKHKEDGKDYPACETNADMANTINAYWEGKGYKAPAIPVRRVVKVGSQYHTEYTVNIVHNGMGIPEKNKK